MSRKKCRPPNLNRVAMGRRDRSKRKGLSVEGRQRLREAVLYYRPWRFPYRFLAGRVCVASREENLHEAEERPGKGSQTSCGLALGSLTCGKPASKSPRRLAKHVVSSRALDQRVL